jgi:hypothetical protein
MLFFLYFSLNFLRFKGGLRIKALGDFYFDLELGSNIWYHSSTQVESRCCTSSAAEHTLAERKTRGLRPCATN